MSSLFYWMTNSMNMSILDRQGFFRNESNLSFSWMYQDVIASTREQGSSQNILDETIYFPAMCKQSRLRRSIGRTKFTEFTLVNRWIEVVAIHLRFSILISRLRRDWSIIPAGWINQTYFTEWPLFLWSVTGASIIDGSQPGIFVRCLLVVRNRLSFVGLSYCIFSKYLLKVF